MRQEYWQQVADIDLEDLVFIDEMGVLLGLARTNARASPGDRAYDFKPFYRGSKVSVIGAITQLKAFLRQFSPTTSKMVDILIATAIDLINPVHLRNWFAHCCYCPS